MEVVVIGFFRLDDDLMMKLVVARVRVVVRWVPRINIVIESLSVNVKGWSVWEVMMMMGNIREIREERLEGGG